MTGPSLTKDFHRLMKRIGRLTDGQASIDDVDWDGGNLKSFELTIRPNASFYKNGRFKFTVSIPDTFTSGESPTVWCETDIYHPNIDRNETKIDGNDEHTNVCLNIFETETWNPSYGLEGTVLGLLFLLHNPNIEDPLSPEFDGGDQDIETFAENVKEYMAGNPVDDNYYEIDFRVIDGVFEDLSVITNKAVTKADHGGGDMATGCNDDTNAAETPTVNVTEETGLQNSAHPELSEPSNESKTESCDIKHDATCDKNNQINVVDTQTIEATNGPGTHTTDESEDDDEEIIPVRFVSDKTNCGYFVLQFGGSTDDGNDDNSCNSNITSSDNAVHGADGEEPTNCDTKVEASTAHTKDAAEMSKSVTHLHEVGQNRVISRSVSVPNNFYIKSIPKHKPTEREYDSGFVALAYLALDCLLTIYRNTL